MPASRADSVSILSRASNLMKDARDTVFSRVVSPSLVNDWTPLNRHCLLAMDISTPYFSVSVQPCPIMALSGRSNGSTEMACDDDSLIFSPEFLAQRFDGSSDMAISNFIIASVGLSSL